MDSQGGDGWLFSRRNSMDISPLYAAVVALIGGAADAGRDGHAGDLLGVARKNATVLARARRARDKSPMEEFLQRIRGAESVVERCAYCDFTVSARLEQTRQASTEHVCGRPKPTTKLRRRRLAS
jgi:hypothetical protein